MNEKFLEDLMWMACRYAIGRHSYVSSFAQDIGSYFYDKMSDTCKQDAAYDIRRQIRDNLQFQPFNFCILYNYGKECLKPLETFFEFVNTQDTTDKNWLGKVSHIDVYRNSNGECHYDVAYYEHIPFETHTYEHDILDLQPWMDLASLFDVKNHKIIVCDDGKGGISEIECYESYINETVEDSREGSVVYLKSKPWKYKKIYRPVKNGVSNSFIEPSFIKEVKNINSNI